MLPKRKQLRLKDYDYSQNGLYYVTICTQNRALILTDTVGAHLCVHPNYATSIVEKCLLELESKYKAVRIDKFVIMPNHIHFILEIQQPQTGAHIGAPLPDMVKWFKTQTTNAYINGVKAGLCPRFNKHLWQRGYYEEIIVSDSHYLHIWNYIDTNLLKWEVDRYFNS